MQKISKFILKNFKFFYGSIEINIERKHVLLYGENGSGKSSIYWALYTFLQSVFKTDNREIRKYFDPKHDENLINRYADDADGSAIIVELEDENGAVNRREISNERINSKSDNLIKETALGSDFLDYRVLSRIYAYYHKEEIDLFDFFDHHLLSFINFRKELIKPGETTGSKNAEYWWHYVKQGLNPHPKMNDPIYINFQKVVRDFNEEFEYYITDISRRANILLKDKFDEKFRLNIEFRKATYNAFNGYNKGRNKKTLPPQLVLSIEITNAVITDPNKRVVFSPQSFLNEARLSTMALAMRLAIINERFVEEYPKILVLDDLLVSLDMSNREFVLNIILEYTKDFQVFFFTHQRGLFEDAKKFIEGFHAEQERKAGETDKSKLSIVWTKYWNVYELYETENLQGIPIPQLQPYETSLQKAYKYFKGNIDYTACGNNLRTALEEFFREFLPHTYLRDDEGHLLDEKKLMLDNLLIRARTYFDYIGFDTKLIDRLERYKSRSLNPSSHFNPRIDYFKRELQDVFSIIENLKKNKNQPLLRKDDKIKFNIITESGKAFSYTAILLDDIILYKKNDGSASFFKDEDERGYVMIGCTVGDATRRLSHEVKKYTLQQLYDETIDFINKTEISVVETDMFKVFKNVNDGTLESLKMY